MIFIHGMLNGTRYGWELVMFNKLREFSDGISFFEFNINLDRYVGDHSPRFEFSIVVFNYSLIDFSVYNIYHVDQDGYRG